MRAAKKTVRRTLATSIARGDRLVTDAAVFQKILHGYCSMHRADAIRAVFDALHGVVDDVCAVKLAGVERAEVFMLAVPSFSARRAVHVAIMQRRGVRRVISLDAGFDAFPWVKRIRR